MTAPLAIIKVDGVPVGKMKSIRCVENKRLGRVMGIGSMTPDELPPLEWTGTLNCAAYTIDFKDPVIKDSVIRKVNSLQEWVDTVLLQEDGVTIDIMRKVKDSVDPVTKIVKSKLEVFASIKGCFATRESFDITENQISGRDTDFEYTTPILYPV